MAAQGGAGLLVRAYINGTPTTIGGARQKGVKINNGEIDVTHSDSPGRWQELLGGVAVKSLEIDISGVLLGTYADKFIASAALNGVSVPFDIIVPGLGTFSGNFLISAYHIQTEHNKEIPYSGTIKSTGMIAFA